MDSSGRSLARRAHRALAAFLALLVVPSPAAERRTLDFDRGWRFHLGDLSGAEAPGFDDSGWRTLDLPHDWSIEGAFSDTNPAGANGGALPGGVGWYRKTFSVAARDTGRLVFVEFDGAYRNSEVWINGHYLGKRPYGYSSFRYELTRQLRYGRASNVIAVRVDNSQQPNSRWYAGSGIYRHVRLVTTAPVHVDHWGTYVTTPDVTRATARVTMRTTVRNASQADQPITLRTVLYDAAGRQVAAASAEARVARDSISDIAQDLAIRNPALWSLDRPYLYRAVSRVVCGGKPCDEYDTPFGVRTFVFDPDRGFILNGTPVKIRGVCLHHDLGALGAAVNTRALERQLELMRDMGVNAIRTSHNPPAPELLDLTDRMGFIVLDEAFDMWKKEKTKYDYHHEAWSSFPAQFPGGKFIITEAMSALNSRGVYEQPSDSIASYATPYVKDSGPQPNKNYRLSSYDDRKAFWGSLHEESLRLFERYPFLSGMFIWQGIDYLGEPTPYEWHARSSYFGVVDLAGFPKDPFYLYESEWTTRPMLHVFPHWNWTPGDTIDVWGYTR